MAADLHEASRRLLAKSVELRRKAEDQLKSKFNIRDFHDHLLSEGAIPLDLLEKKMTAWIAACSAETGRVDSSTGQ